MTNYEWLVKNDKLARFVYDIKFLDGYDLMQEYKMKFPYENLTFERIGEWLQEEHEEPLKCCPFCGNDKPRIIERSGVMLYEIYCDECGSKSDECLSENEAIYRWNRRAEK